LRIEIRSRFGGRVLFAHEKENNSVKATLEAGIRAGVDFYGADLSNAWLYRAELSCARLPCALLSGSNISWANLIGANLSGSDLTDVDLSYTDMSAADMSKTKLINTNMEGATLDGACLDNANAAMANFDRAELNGASFRWANMDGATYGKGVEIGNNPLIIHGLTWPVYVFKTHIRIGCRIHTKKEWLEFDDDAIRKMDYRATEFWAKWKKHILWMAFDGTE
jgi:hypothetical protein